MSIYTINNDLLRIIDDIENIQPNENDPDWSIQQQELMKEFEQLSDSLDDKVDNILKFRRQTETDVIAIDQEIARLKHIRQRKETRVVWLTNLIDFMMKAQGLTEKETALFTIKYKKNPPKCIIKDEEKAKQLIPDERKNRSLIRNELTPTEEVRHKLEAIWFSFSDSINPTMIKQRANEFVEKKLQEIIPTIENFDKMKKSHQNEAIEKMKATILSEYSDIFEMVQEQRLDIQ